MPPIFDEEPRSPEKLIVPSSQRRNRRKQMEIGSLAECVAALAGLAGLVVAVLLAIIAIWSDDLKSQLRRPKLEIRMADPWGEWTLLGDPPKWPAIYFHAVVENLTPSMVATSVEVFISKCWIHRKDGSVTKLPLPSPLPIKARRGHAAIDIGATSKAYDVIQCLDKERQVWILLQEGRPNNFQSVLVGGERMEIVLQAKALNSVSNWMEIEIQWDGHFPNEENGLGDHLVLNITNYPAPSVLGFWSFLAKFGRSIASQD